MELISLFFAFVFGVFIGGLIRDRVWSNSAMHHDAMTEHGGSRYKVLCEDDYENLKNLKGTGNEK